MKRAFLFFLLIVVPGCGLGMPVSGGDGNQVWRFALRDENQAIFALADGAFRGDGSGIGYVESWKIQDEASFGCDYYLRFKARFSGSLVSMDGFIPDIRAGSSCDINTQGKGDGGADSTYGSATRASGTVMLSFRHPQLGPSGGVFNWDAIRIK